MRRVWDLAPIRWPGLILLAVALWVALRFSRDQADYLLHPAALGAVGLVAVCALSVTLGALVLRRKLRRAEAGVPETMETLVTTHTEFRCPRFAAWPLIDVNMRWAEPSGVTVELTPARGAFAESVTPRQRGRHARVVRVFTVEDVFGLAAVRFRVAWEQPFAIAPASATTSAELAASHAHGDVFASPTGRAEGDLVEMRRYAPGDPLRHILWKTFARTRRLLVRVPERATAPQPITVAFLVAGPGDEPTAAAARLYLERGILGPDFIFAADGAARPTRDPREALDQIIDSAAARGDGGATLAGLAAQVERSRMTSCLVFVPPRDGPWRARVIDLARQLAAPATAIIGVDGAETPPRGLFARLLVARDGDEDGESFSSLPALRAALEADGLRVQVLHRTTGQVL